MSRSGPRHGCWQGYGDSYSHSACGTCGTKPPSRFHSKSDGWTFRWVRGEAGRWRRRTEVRCPAHLAVADVCAEMRDRVCFTYDEGVAVHCVPMQTASGRDAGRILCLLCARPSGALAPPHFSTLNDVPRPAVRI